MDRREIEDLENCNVAQLAMEESGGLQEDLTVACRTIVSLEEELAYSHHQLEASQRECTQLEARRAAAVRAKQDAELCVKATDTSQVAAREHVYCRSATRHCE